MGCIQHLIAKGARVNARDLAGHTPLFHCTGMMATGLTLKIADILLKNGADVNATNRMGCTPLFEPAMSSRFDCVDFLLVNLGDLKEPPFNFFPKLTQVYELSF